MKDERVVISRYETKCLISESKARAIRDYIQCMCSPDSYAGPDNRYNVNNFYFDTPDLRFYYDTKFKQFNRFKLRVRFYGNEPGKYLWLEVKHKLQKITWKTRRRIEYDRWEGIFDEAASRMVENGERPGAVIKSNLRESFENAVLRYGAAPVIHVRYSREPYISDYENYCRITFDRGISSRATHGDTNFLTDDTFVYFDDAETASCNEDDSPVVLEIKTETDVPRWVLRMIQHFELQQRGFSKYCYAVDRCILETCTPDRISSMLSVG